MKFRDKKHTSLILLVLTSVASLFFLASLRMPLKPGWEVEVDAYYHVAMADRGPGFCMQKTFPWTDASIWKERFYDKELMFHVVLSGVRNLLAACGLDGGTPPFNIPAMFFATMFIAGFAWVAWRTDPDSAFLLPPLLVLLTPTFANRCIMLRPHVLAVTIMVLAVYFLTVRRKNKDQFITAFIFGFAMAYAYSNPHFLLIPASAACLAFLAKRQWCLLLPVGALAGIIAGLIVHPQFPNTFLLWKVQCLDVVMEILSGRVKLDIGNELMSPTAEWLAYNSGVFALLAINIMAAFYIFIKKGAGKFGIDTMTLLFLQATLAAALFFSTRVIEYLVPFSVLATGALARDFRNICSKEDLSCKSAGGDFRWLFQKPMLLIMLLILVLTAVNWKWTSKMKNGQFYEFSGYGRWAGKNLPPGTLVAHVGWGDFTRLFYSAPECRYLVGMDPMFAHVHKPEMMRRLSLFKQGIKVITPAEMKSLTGASFVFVGRDGYKLAEYMDLKLGYRPLYAGLDGYLFSCEQ